MATGFLPLTMNHEQRTTNHEPRFMQNKPNFRNVQMAVNLVKTMTNNNELRTMNYSKQTQSNPISKGAPMLLCGALLRTSFAGMTILKISAFSAASILLQFIFNSSEQVFINLGA